MTYKQLDKIKNRFLILFIIFIFLHNFQHIFITRNWPFFSIKVQKPATFSTNKSKTEVNPQLAAIYANKLVQNEQNTWHLPLVKNHNKEIQTGSLSRCKLRTLSLLSWGKGLIISLKVCLQFCYLSLKYRFFYLKNGLATFRQNLIWLLEGNFATREANLGKAFVFAELSGAPEELYHSFKVIGILHLIAASSANIHLLLAFFKPISLVLEYFFGKKALICSSLTLISIYFYLVNASFSLVDSSPSILRASLAVGLTLLARYYYHWSVQALYLLVVIGILCLIINPFYLQSLGFQLSFLASFVLIFYWPFIKKKIAKSGLMLSFTVQFFMWPVLIMYFSSVNLIAIPANVILSPLVEFLSVLFFAFLTCQFLHWPFIADFLSSLIYLVSNIFFSILNLLEKLPGKSLTIDQNKSLIVTAFLLIDLLIIYLIIRSKNRDRKKNKYKILSKWANYSFRQ